MLKTRRLHVGAARVSTGHASIATGWKEDVHAASWQQQLSSPPGQRDGAAAIARMAPFASAATGAGVCGAAE